MPGAMRLRLSSAARMRRPVTTGDKARTTCSTSGSSGIAIDEGQDLQDVYKMNEIYLVNHEKS